MESTSAQQRAKWVERWQASGLTAKEFGAEVGLKASALYYWRAQRAAATRKGAEDRHESPEPSARSSRMPAAEPEDPSAAPSLRFVELPVAAVAGAPPMLELLLGDVRVRVPSGFDEATLTRVVRALGAAR